jgi:hypothetical protein
MSRGARKFGKHLVPSMIVLVADHPEADEVPTLIPPPPRTGFGGYAERRTELDLLWPRADAETQEAILTMLRKATGN